MSLIYSFHLIFIFFFSILHIDNATEEQCYKDCRETPDMRLVGPTRPFHAKDAIGKDLSLTRPHPYNMASSMVTIMTFNVTLRMQMENWPISGVKSSIGRFERLFIIKSMQRVMAQFATNKVRFFEVMPQGGVDSLVQPFVDFILETEVIADFNGYNYSSTNLFFENDIVPSIHDSVVSGNMTGSYVQFASQINSNKILTNISLDFAPGMGDNIAKNGYRVHREIKTDSPNMYVKFCEVGCTLFFSDGNHTTFLSACMKRCDNTYQYNITVGYNDLVETARLECRDGCQIALIRCQPGYYCTQVTSKYDEFGTRNGDYSGGIMTPCQPGTYRDVSYESVEDCVDCPPGRFREDIKGRNLESCTKCPVGTYASSPGSDLVRDCIRCPAGRFSSEKGAGECRCVTEGSCKVEQLPCPADAEKRDTIPFIGVW